MGSKAVEQSTLSKMNGGDGGAAVTSAPVTLAGLVPFAARCRSDGAALLGLDRSEGEHVLSWSEVDVLTQSMAIVLVSAGVRPGDRVLVSMHKSSASFLSMHAALRAGAVCVPLDPLAPSSQAASVIASTEPVVALVDPLSGARLEPLLDGDETAVMDPGSWIEPQGDGVPIPDAPAELPDVQPGDPAYLIFTSGSTGTPKGMLHTHRSGLAYAELAVATHGIDATDRLAGMSPLHFDMSTLELYAAPLAAAAVVVIPDTHLRMPASFVERSVAHDVTVWYTVPFQLRQIESRGALDRRDLSSLRHVIYAGEPYPPGALAALMTQLPAGTRVSNAYGPAETNVVTVHELAGPPEESNDVPLGRAWGEVRLRVAGPDGLGGPEAAPGEPGELWVQCPTMMEGYWQRPDLDDGCLVTVGDDAASALSAPEGATAPAGRWYRTGDIVVKDNEGILWFRGRADHQVKVRGVRIELEAVESVVTDAPGVLHAVVGPRFDSSGVPELVAAVVVDADHAALGESATKGTGPLSVRTLQRWCGPRLAAAAIPQAFDVVSEVPLTASGKIDRRRVRALLAGTAAQRRSHGDD